jgi:hypothetical protein
LNYYETINYDAVTGEFTWAVARKGVRAGAKAGTVRGDGYLQIKVGKRAIRAHRLAWFLGHGVWPDGEIDHINGDRLDNRLCNLRVVDRAGNSQNRMSAHKDSSHGFLGATWNRQHRKWQAKLMARGVRHHLGYFSTPEAAHAAYMEAKRLHHLNGGGH